MLFLSVVWMINHFFSIDWINNLQIMINNFKKKSVYCD